MVRLACKGWRYLDDLREFRDKVGNAAALIAPDDLHAIT
jgi:hypothetical protein